MEQPIAISKEKTCMMLAYITKDIDINNSVTEIPKLYKLLIQLGPRYFDLDWVMQNLFITILWSLKKVLFIHKDGATNS